MSLEIEDAQKSRCIRIKDSWHTVKVFLAPRKVVSGSLKFGESQ